MNTEKEMPERVWLANWLPLPASDPPNSGGTMFASTERRDDATEYLRRDLHESALTELRRENERLRELADAVAWIETNAVVANTITGSEHIAWRAILSSIYGECEEEARTLVGAVAALRARIALTPPPRDEKEG